MYSDWQLNRLRNALRAYHQYGRGSQHERFNWKDVSEAISLSTEAQVPPERLRQFVEGIRSKDGARRKFGTMMPESIEAIVKFLTEEQLMLPEELEEHVPPTQAALRLLEYLDQKFDRVRQLPVVTYEGTYTARHLDERFMSVFELTLDHRSREGMMPVTKTEERFLASDAGRYDGWTPEQRRQKRLKRTLYSGWAIFTPEENVLVFLKESDNGANLYQFTLAADVLYAAGAPVERLILQRHVYPMELENTNQNDAELLRSVSQETQKNILIFRRSM
jgi:hypothetical protein